MRRFLVVVVVNKNSSFEDRSVEADRIAADMAAVRSRSRESVSQLQHDLDRLTDWREYIRSYPVPLLASAVVAGFVLAPARTRSKVAPAPAMQPVVSSPRSVTEGAKSALLSAMGTAMAGAVRAYFQKQLHSFIENLHHDRPPSEQKNA